MVCLREDAIESPPPIAGLAREMNRLHQEFILHFSGHVRMTRDLAQLDDLLAYMEALQRQATAQAFQSEGRWQSLLDLLARRLQEYQSERGAVAQIQASASLQDRQASQQTARARLVLHRFARHFSGQSRRTRDIERLTDILLETQEIFQALRPLAQAIHLRSVAEEIGAVGGYVEFLTAEREELLESRRAGSLADQSDNWQLLLANLENGWKTEVQGQPRATRRPGLLHRYITSLDGVLEGLMTARHANLPDQHELAIEKAARLLVRWQDELAELRNWQDALPPAERVSALWTRAQELVQVFLGHWTGDPANALGSEALGDLCDSLDEVERQLSQLAREQPLAVPPARLAWLRDALVTAEQHFDQSNSWQQP